MKETTHFRTLHYKSIYVNVFLLIFKI